MYLASPMPKVCGNLMQYMLMVKVIDQTYTSLTTISQRPRTSSSSIFQQPTTNTEMLSNVSDPSNPIIASKNTDYISQTVAVNELTENREVISSSPLESSGHVHDGQTGEESTEIESGSRDGEIVTAANDNLETLDDDVPLPKTNPRKRKSKSKDSQNVSKIQKKLGPPTKRRRLYKNAISPVDELTPRQPPSASTSEKSVLRRSDVNKVSDTVFV